MTPNDAIISMLLLGALAALVGFAWAPGLLRLLQKHKCWKKQVRTVAPDGSATPIFSSMHKEREVSVPRMAGVLIWVTTFALALLFAFIAPRTEITFLKNLNFLSRGETWIPLFTLVAASILGLLDDLLVVAHKGETHKGGGIKFRHRFLVVFAIALIGAWWFHYKLGWDAIHLPFDGEYTLGFWYVPLFIAVTLGFFSSSIVDGIDGLAGGIFAIDFATFGAIAFSRHQYVLAAFCAVIAGTLMAFLWYNIPPAKFYMGETGIMGLTTTLSVVAFLTDSVLLLPLIGFTLIIEAGSVALQLASKCLRHGKKIFLVAPLHHHFEAKGWTPPQVTMRFWLITAITNILAFVVVLLEKR